jgi:hypothetical protein
MRREPRSEMSHNALKTNVTANGDPGHRVQANRKRS